MSEIWERERKRVGEKRKAKEKEENKKRWKKGRD